MSKLYEYFSCVYDLGDLRQELNEIAWCVNIDRTKLLNMMFNYHLSGENYDSIWFEDYVESCIKELYPSDDYSRKNGSRLRGDEAEQIVRWCRDNARGLYDHFSELFASSGTVVKADCTDDAFVFVELLRCIDDNPGDVSVCSQEEKVTQW